MPAKTKAPKEKVVVASPSVTQKGVTASNVDSAQTLKAFKALAAHAAKRKGDASSSTDLPLDGPQGDLRDPNNAVYVQITINSLNQMSKVKPVRINLAHALHAPGSTSVCLLVKDPQREYKDLLTAHKIKSVERVVGVTKLKGKFKPFEARRALVQEHDLFLADQRIVPLLPTLCGKVFFDAKKHPITVNVQKTGAALQAELDGAIKSTSFLQNKGSCSSVKLGYLSSHTPQQLTENLLSALPAVISRLQGGWNNVHNIDVKTGNSAALPIWNQRLGIKTHVAPSTETVVEPTPAAPAVEEDSEEDEEESEEEDEAKPVTPKKISPRKTRSAAARVKAGDTISASAPTTPVKSMASTPRKIASSVSKSARKAR